jgi:predicted NAD-dependent protein-ADP-ribosyltransferase YbiA (DUF1768 family)
MTFPLACLPSIPFQTAEHWMMASKARLFGDDASLAKILMFVDIHSAASLIELAMNDRLHLGH